MLGQSFGNENGKKKRVVFGALVFGALAFIAAPSGSRADDEGLIEVEESLADSEAAIAEEEEARLRAQEEKNRNEEAKRQAIREAEQAKKVEAGARQKITRWNDLEKKAKAERLAAEKRIAAAQERQRVAEEQMRIAQEHHDVAKLETEKAVSERDQADAAADSLQERKEKVAAAAEAARQRYRKTLGEVDAAKARIVAEEKALAKAKILSNKEMTDMKTRLLSKRKELRALETQLTRAEKGLRLYKMPAGGQAGTRVAEQPARDTASDPVSSLRQAALPTVAPDAVGATSAPTSLVPASVARAADGGRNEGWVRVKHECDVRRTAAADAQLTSRRKAGERLYAKKSAPGWMSVRTDDGKEGFMSTNCFR